MNLFIYLACIVIALRFIFIFRIWSFVFEYVVVRWQGENGKEARKIVFCSLVFRVIFNFRNLQWPAYIEEEDYHKPIDENGSLFTVLYLFSNWSRAKFLTKRNDKNELAGICPSSKCVRCDSALVSPPKILRGVTRAINTAKSIYRILKLMHIEFILYFCDSYRVTKKYH